MAPGTDSNRPTLRSVTIALDILETFGEDAEVRLTELTRRAGIAKSTASRTCSVKQIGRAHV